MAVKLSTFSFKKKKISRFTSFSTTLFSRATSSTRRSVRRATRHGFQTGVSSSSANSSEKIPNSTITDSSKFPSSNLTCHASKVQSVWLIVALIRYTKKHRALENLNPTLITSGFKPHYDLPIFFDHSLKSNLLLILLAQH